MTSLLMLEAMNKLKKKDRRIYNHSLRVAGIAEAVAYHLCLDEKQTYQLVNGCWLHDIGKLMIPMKFMHRTALISPIERNMFKRYPTVGAEILRELDNIDGHIIDIVELHHERWDGKGFPYGLREQAIPVFARICAISNAYDNMVTNPDRPYYMKLSSRDAKEQLLMDAGTLFDPYYVHICISLFDLIDQQLINQLHPNIC